MQIGRFRVLRTLGRGAEGLVYLAVDLELGRQVAIKTLALSHDTDPALADRLLDAARNVSTLSHPNVVPVFEAGRHEGKPFVVFEFVQGETLKHLIATKGALPMARAAVMMTQILAGVAHVHAAGVVHGDLKPANILIGANGIPRVTDFGISRRAQRPAAQNVPTGTVRYMAPECFGDGRTDYRFDVYALGLIFYEMLTGEPVVTDGDEFAQIYRIVSETPPAPSEKNTRIAPEIDAIVLKALSKNPTARYADAAEMKRDLDRFSVPLPAKDRVELNEHVVPGTVEFLLRRMAYKSDFPALSASFTRINQLSSVGDDESLRTLSELVIRDFALTQKLLRIVNSVAFGTTKITKVSQALIILGVSQLRSIATSMMLSAGGKIGKKSPEVSGALTDAFIIGVIARNIGRMMNLHSVEELFICGMFMRLGRLLALYYLPDENAEINRRIDEEGIDPGAASRSVLGLTFDELGAVIARKWNFPEAIVNAMASLPPGELSPASVEAERMWQCAGYARELCDAVVYSSSERREHALRVHIERFKPIVLMEQDQVRELITHTVEAAHKFAAVSGLKQPRSALLDAMTSLCPRLQMFDFPQTIGPASPPPADSMQANSPTECATTMSGLAGVDESGKQASLVAGLLTVWRWLICRLLTRA